MRYLLGSFLCYLSITAVAISAGVVDGISEHDPRTASHHPENVVKFILHDQIIAMPV
jgi:hypothetical protein